MLSKIIRKSKTKKQIIGTSPFMRSSDNRGLTKNRLPVLCPMLPRCRALLKRLSDRKWISSSFVCAGSVLRITMQREEMIWASI